MSTFRHCEHEGCLDRDVIECNLNDNENTQYFFCVAHCYEEGFCWGCGGFWCGFESFDFNNPSHLCQNCREENEDDRYDPEIDFGF